MRASTKSRNDVNVSNRDCRCSAASAVSDSHVSTVGDDRTAFYDPKLAQSSEDPVRAAVEYVEMDGVPFGLCDVTGNSTTFRTVSSL